MNVLVHMNISMFVLSPKTIKFYKVNQSLTQHYKEVIRLTMLVDISSLDDILKKYQHKRGEPFEDFELFCFFSHNIHLITKEQLKTICLHNVSDGDKISMIEEILDKKVNRLFSALGIIVNSIDDKQTRSLAFFIIGESKLLSDDHFRLLYYRNNSHEWRDGVLMEYARSHTKDQINQFHQLIHYKSQQFIIFERSNFETPEGEKVGIIKSLIPDH